MRLADAVARLVDQGIIREKVVFQTGHTPFTHPKMECIPFLPIDAFENHVRRARLFITHAGEGNIGTGILARKRMIIVPRLKKWGEHTDDHQLELAHASHVEQFGNVVEDMEGLAAHIQKKRWIKFSSKSIGYIPRILERIARETNNPLLSSLPSKKKKSTPPKSASIVVATLNGGEPLIRAVDAMLGQKFDGKFEIIVVDDGSFDGNTPQQLRNHFGKNKKVKIITLPRSGVCKARNTGIQAASGEVIINMDHDCIPHADWLQTMVNGFNSPDVGAVSAYGHYGGTSTGFKKDLLNHLGGYDEDFFYYREDTDLSFRIIELGFAYQKITGARYTEDRTLVTPKGIMNILGYTLQRLRYHMNDVLLRKKHRTPLCDTFLHVRGKVFIDPVADFKVATGLWEDDEKEPVLSSPRGLTFLSNRGIFHFAAITFIGIGYALAIKVARLAGSIRHGHLLV
ncbi:MAG: glycosyltransferase [Candidatus Diapherotrites archaeon]|nr:glycosyltransferase [Candidatus Diapherotrites archaeon]